MERNSLIPEIPLTAANVAKLGLATDPRTSSLAIYPKEKSRPVIWGLIDQENESHAFSVFDSESGAERPGIFSLAIIGPGHIVATRGFSRLAELRSGKLVREPVPALSGGPVRAILQPHIDAHLRRVEARVPQEMFDARSHWRASLESEWLQTLARLLNRMKSHGHGGALLIADEPAESCLNIKYRLSYSRITRALENGAASRIVSVDALDQIHGDYFDSNADHLPMDLYLDAVVEDNDANDSKSELNGALWFVSLLSRVDGLVLMTSNLSVVGFGVEVTCLGVPPGVAIARDRMAKRVSSQVYEHYGTRHRSMMRFCYAEPGSLGFVISQDGAIRAMTRIEDQVVIWDDLRLDLNHFAQLPTRAKLARHQGDDTSKS